MTRTPSSALITDEGQRVLLRLQGQVYQLSQPDLRDLLGLPACELGLGITLEGDRFCFEFPADDQTIELSARQLLRRVAKQVHKPLEPGAEF